MPPPVETTHNLHQIALRLNSSLDVRQVLNGILEEATKAVRAECGIVLTVDASGRLVPQVTRHRAGRGADTPDAQPWRPIADRVAREGLPVLDPGSDGRTLLSVPLKTAETFLGVLYLDRPSDTGAFSSQDLELLAALASTAALALHNARRYEAAARSVAELRRLYDTSLDITSQLETDRLLTLIIHRAAELLHGDSGNFYFYDPDANLLVPCAPYGQHAVEPVPPIRPGEGATGLVYLSGEPLQIDDYDTWEGRLPQIPRGRYARVLHVPVKRGRQVLGVVSVNRGRDAAPFDEEDTRLLQLFATQAAIAIDNARLYRLSIEKASIERELQVAHQVQASLIPRAIPDVRGWSFAVHWQPAREVSGDFYDFIPFENGELGLVIGDVTGKGVPAALMMATTRALLRGAVHQFNSPGQVLESVNQLLQPDMPPRTFVTALYAILDPGSGRLRLANAGHSLPYQRSAEGVHELRAAGLPLGLLAGMHYEEKETIIAPGDLLFLMSDGLVEAHNARREMFGQRRMVERMANASTEQALIDSLLAELTAFAGPTWEQEDDITLVAARRVV